MRFKCILLLLGLTLIAPAASAQDWIFLGNPGDWNSDANWDQGTVPTSTSNVLLGHDATVSTAMATISGPLTEPTIGDLRIGAGGSFGGAVGTLNHSAGTLNSNTGAWAFVGVDGPPGNPNTGTYNLSGTAIFNNDSHLHIGIGGTVGASNQGFLDIRDTATMNLNEFYVGSNDNNFGTVTQAGGTVNAVTAYVGDATFGVPGVGAYNQSAGDVVVQDWLSIGRQGGASGTYNMSGGTLTVMNDYLTVGEVGGSSGEMNVSNDASINTANLAVGRFGEAAVGLLNVVGDQASITAGSLLVGVNDQDSFNPTNATGTLRFESSTGNVSPINVTNDVYLNDGTSMAGGAALLEVDLLGARSGGDITLVNVGMGGTVTGTFMGLAEGAMVPNSGMRTITYMGGDGNDIVLRAGGAVVDGDFNNDSVWNCTDIDALTAAIAGSSTDLSFDMNGDGVITAADVTDAGTGWLAVGGANNPAQTGGNAFLPGDATLDGNVNGQDFIVWNNNKFTSVAAWCSGDFTLDGVVNGQDFIVWNNNKFTSSDQVSSVPEPACGWLLASALTLLVFRRSA